MAFGKPGRPPEDRLARQCEIYETVAPLILRAGARRLSMRDAARAAHMSVGGLYHYFPTKRDLVLHGLREDARDRLCREYYVQIADIAGWSVERYIEAYLDFSMQMFEFARPAVRAALELGVEEFQSQLDAGLTANVEELTGTLRQMVPDLSERDLEALARGIRRVGLGMLVDQNAASEEIRAHLRALIEGYAIDSRRHTPQLLEG